MMMDRIFGDQNFQTLLIYLDDILVFGKNFEETLDPLDMVLSRLKSANLKVKPSKCQLFKKQLRYLGHVVSKVGILPDPEKTAAVNMWAKPKTETELRGFLCIAGYFRRFVKDFAKIADPLHSLLHGPGKRSKKSNRKPLGIGAWDSSCDAAFQQLKQKLTEAPVLSYPDFKHPFVLEVDARIETGNVLC